MDEYDLLPGPGFPGAVKEGEGTYEKKDPVYGSHSVFGAFLCPDISRYPLLGIQLIGSRRAKQ
jgi:hypothetical protein